MSAPAVHDLTLYQGATNRLKFTWRAGTPLEPVDLTGCQARLQVRSEAKSPKALITLSTEDGSIILGGTAGTVEAVFSPARTKNVDLVDGVYAVEIIFGGGTGDVRRILRGKCSIDPEVTRD